MIGVILKGYPRLSETFIAQELLLLERRGFRLAVFSMRGPREALRQPVVAGIRARVRYMPQGGAWRLLWGNAVACVRFPGPYLAAFVHAAAKAAARLRTVSLVRFLEAGWLVAAERLGAGSPVTHLHAHFLHAPAEVAFYASWICGLSYSVTAHAKDIYTSPPADLAERVNASRFTLTCTGYNRAYLSAVPGLDASRVSLAYHGVDLSTFRPRRRGTGDLRRLLSIGRLVPKKGFDQVLYALAALAGAGEAFHWDHYGAGELEAELRALTERLGLQRRVTFHGAVARPALVERLEEGGLCVFGCAEAEDGDRDGIPNALLEAMAMGVPVVATSVSGLPEAVRDGVDGLLVPPRDPEALAAAVRRLFGDPDLAARLAASARERVLESFDAEACIEACARRFETVQHEEDTVLLPTPAGSRAPH